MDVPLSRLARQLIAGEINFNDYYSQLSDEQRFRGDAKLLGKLLRDADRLELTPRERDVLCCAARGMTSRETAAELRISYESERSMRKYAIHRLGARNIAHAVAIFLTRSCEDARAE